MVNKRASELTEGQWITYRPEHPSGLLVRFEYNYGQRQMYVYDKERPEEGVSFYMPDERMDALQQDMVNNNAVEVERQV